VAFSCEAGRTAGGGTGDERQFNISLMSGEEERILEIYGECIIPALARVTASG